MKKAKLFILILISSCLPMMAQQQFKRDLKQSTFVPKGQLITGLSVSYSQSNQSDYQFFIVEGISGDTYSFKLSPMVMYAFKDNMTVGGRLSYSRAKTQLDAADVVIDSETNYEVDHLYSISNNYSAIGAFRNYISFGNNKRFAFFNEVQLELGIGESKICNGTGDDLTGTYETKYNVGIGLKPGLVMFLNNYSAIEVTVGVLGFSYSHARSETDKVYVSHRNSTSASLNVNLLSLGFGMSFYL